MAYTFFKTLKEIFEIVEWYKWLLSFNPAKYISLAIMTAGPMFFIYRIVFLDAEAQPALLYASGTFLVGMLIWIASWDPYS